MHEKESSFVAVIDGSMIQKLSDYLKTISEIFKFPFPAKSLDGYNDWMRDLEWLNKEEYILVIKNYGDFLNKDLPSKKIVLDGLAAVILPWWQGDVEKYIVGGKKKPFSVYLVD